VDGGVVVAHRLLRAEEEGGLGGGDVGAGVGEVLEVAVGLGLEVADADGVGAGEGRVALVVGAVRRELAVEAVQRVVEAGGVLGELRGSRDGAGEVGPVGVVVDAGGAGGEAPVL
jgi:hypothetical protein